MTAAKSEADRNWDLSAYFDAFRSPAYRTWVDALRADVEALVRHVAEEPPGPDTSVDAWAEVLCSVEALGSRVRHLGSYLGCLGADDTRDEAVQQEQGVLQVLGARLARVDAAVTTGLGALDEDSYAKVRAHPEIEGAGNTLDRMRQRASWSMERPLEELAADLGVTGSGAWGRLYSSLAGKLTFRMAGPDGEPKDVPMALRRSLMEDVDPAVRREAFVAGNAAWEEVSHVAGAALNAIAGARLTLHERRGVPHFLDAACFDSAVSRKTLDALMEAIAKNYELPRTYLRRKRSALGLSSLGFQDQSCPLPLKSTRPIPWSEACERILKAYDVRYPRLADYVRESLRERWVESEPRAGKSPGAFCTSSPELGQSRIFMSYNHTAGDVQTLAHELGHAFHNDVMKDMRLWARRYPMTLAETASTFAESLYTESVLADPEADAAERAQILDTRMEKSVAFLLNIPMRFNFERRLHEERAQGEVPVARLRELMTTTQAEIFGDALDPEQLDPFFWASKLHFYITGISFYNYPYVFGYLFSLAITARAAEDGEDFLPRYERFLRMTGSAPVEKVARDALGFDTEDPAFWEACMAPIRADLDAWGEAVAAAGLG